ncbi:hypothetical protein OSTOST_01482 [Ostertagia ostertagi]
MLLSALLIFVLYQGQTFEGFYFHARMVSPTISIRVNVMLFTLIGINIAGLAFTIALHILTPNRQTRMSLSTKFQSAENLIASKLLLCISTLQFTTLCLSQGVLLCVRIYASESSMSFALKEITDLFTYYTLVMPALSRLYFVKMKAKGRDGWRNYSTVIQKQWN